MKRFAAALVLVFTAGALAPTAPAVASAGDQASRTTTQVSGDQTRGYDTFRRHKPKRKGVQPGRYVGNFYTSSGKMLEEFSFRVTKNRKIKGFNALLNVTCSTYPTTVETHPFWFPTTPVRGKGAFGKVWTPNADSRIALSGKLKNAELVTGSLDYTVGICVRTALLHARRVGR